MGKNIQSIMAPQSVAVVGASNRPGSVGNAVVNNILKGGYQGILYPVNPKARSVSSVRAYPSLMDIPDAVDLAVIIVPAPVVKTVVEQAAEKKVKGLVIITAGFKEIGGHGVTLEKELQEIVESTGISLIGPNCLGIMNTNETVSLNASFAQEMPRKGGIAFISQSGALCTSVLAYARTRNVGFSKFISFGNKADINEIDLLEYLGDDPDTETILMYLEDISDGRRFIETAREITWKAKKPMLAIKSGSSAAGARAAASHTGSLSGSDSAYDAIFFQSGIQRVESITELFHYAIAFARQPIPKGNRIAIITNAGGPGIMTTDAAVRHNIELARLSDDTTSELKKQLPPTASIANPVDIIGDATSERYEASLRAILKDDNVDGAIVILSPQAMSKPLETAKIIPQAAEGIDKPILSSFMGIVDLSEAIRYLESNKIPNYVFPESSVRAMAAMNRFSALLALERREVKHYDVDRDAAARLIEKCLGDGDSHYMTEPEVYDLLKIYGYPLLPYQLITDEAALPTVVESVGFPMAMKITSPDIIHKFDVGGVKLNIASEEEARKVYHHLIESARQYKADVNIQGVLAQKMAPKGIEVIIGSSRDPQFGPVVMFGLGGTYVEVMRDVSFRLAPMWEISAELMIESIKGHKMLEGMRGNPPSDIQAIKDCILRLSQMVTDHREIAELDVNPLIVFAENQGCAVTDGRILLKKRSN